MENHYPRDALPVPVQGQAQWKAPVRLHTYTKQYITVTGQFKPMPCYVGQTYKNIGLLRAVHYMHGSFQGNAGNNFNWTLQDLL